MKQDVSTRNNPPMTKAEPTVALALGGIARADEAGEYAKLLSDTTPALVTVKFVLKIEGQMGKRESETEITGLMVDPTGLVLCANSKLGLPRIMRSFGSATPTDIKILIGDDTEGLEAKVMARDTELDLAWVKIKDLALNTERYPMPPADAPLIPLLRDLL